MSAGKARVSEVCLKVFWVLFACPLFLTNGWSQPYTISTIAGTTRLLDNGSATSAPLSGPISVAVDNSGNLYIADSLDNRIRKVTPAGIISTYAGTGLPGYSGDRGPASLAQLNDPVNIALDSKGYLYVADRGNAVVRRIAPDGTINTIAGRGVTGFSGDNGPATSAEIDPLAVAVDNKGNLYISDGFNYRIRKVDSMGTITTIAGTGVFGYVGDSGSALKALIGLVTGLAVDSAGNLYLADFGEAVVRKIDTMGIITSFAGVGYTSPGTIGDGMPAASTLLIPYGVAFDGSGNIFLSDDYLSEVDRVDLSTGLIYTVAGNGNWGFSGDNGVATAAELYAPAGLTVAGSQIYIADLANTRVRKVANNIITTIAGTSNGDGRPATSAFLNFPEGLAIDTAGDIAVADTSNYEVRRFKPGGNINGYGEVQGQPFGVTVDPAGNFYVSDNEPLVLKIGTDGTTSTIAGNSKSGFSGDGGSAQSASLNKPMGLAVDPANNVYIADNGNHRVRKVDSSGMIHTIAGNGKLLYSGDKGLALSAGMDPYDLALDKASDLFVVDHTNSRIRKITPDGTITTVAGTGTPGYSGDGGPATAARLNFPTGIAIDGSGNLYIADEGNAVVRRVTSNGLITTIAGNGTAAPDSGDGGLATAAQLDPWSVAVNSTGNVYVTDSFNNRIRVLTPFTMKAATFVKVSGDSQSGTVGTTLPAPITLRITDASGAGVPGVVVIFSRQSCERGKREPIARHHAQRRNGQRDGDTRQRSGANHHPGASYRRCRTAAFVVLGDRGALERAGHFHRWNYQRRAEHASRAEPISQRDRQHFRQQFRARRNGPRGRYGRPGRWKNPYEPGRRLRGIRRPVRAPIFDVFPGQLNVQVPSLMPGERTGAGDHGLRYAAGRGESSDQTSRRKPPHRSSFISPTTQTGTIRLRRSMRSPAATWALRD